MCSRHATRRPDKLRQAYPAIDFAKVEAHLRPRYNIGPRQSVLGVASDAPHSASFLSWGLLPGWAKDWKDGARCINAKAEGLATKPSFRSAWKHGRRCVVFADGYLEWTTRDGKKIPELFEVDGGQPFAFAGLWEDWTRPEGDPKAGEKLRTATVITCEANDLVRAVNDRMPVILAGEEVDRWLEGSAEEAAALLRPFDSARMGYREVNPLVNKVGVDLPECLEPPPKPAA
jgi:putative SOS response-associated peptidase YedK